MYKKPRYTGAGLSINASYEGESIESKMERFLHNGNVEGETAPIIFTERKEGVKPAYNIRTDTNLIAIEAMEKVEQIKTAKWEKMNKKDEAKVVEMKPNDGQAESTGGTNN